MIPGAGHLPSLHPHLGAFRQLMCPHPGEFAQFFSKNANARGLAQGGGGGDGHCWNRLMHYQLPVISVNYPANLLLLEPCVLSPLSLK